MSAGPKSWPHEKAHQHYEAFALMRYECKACRHHEIIWNSRDGVTPFGTLCPSCGRPELLHAYFGSDRYAPDHKPHFGQRVWIDMTEARALERARKHLSMLRERGPATSRSIEEIAKSYFEAGTPPDMRIEGYGEQA